jgi:hypothetical protein
VAVLEHVAVHGELGAIDPPPVWRGDFKRPV